MHLPVTKGSQWPRIKISITFIRSLDFLFLFCIKAKKKVRFT